jgi:hypothetical protein
MSSDHYDHEQDERDHYDRENEKQLNSCLFSFKALAILTGLFLIGMLLFSCKAVEPPIAEPFGTVITVEYDVIQVAHAVVNKDPGSQLAAWYYCPGHAFKKGDMFPDFSKCPMPLPYADR